MTRGSLRGLAPVDAEVRIRPQNPDQIIFTTAGKIVLVLLQVTLGGRMHALMNFEGGLPYGNQDRSMTLKTSVDFCISRSWSFVSSHDAD